MCKTNFVSNDFIIVLKLFLLLPVEFPHIDKTFKNVIIIKEKNYNFALSKLI